MKEVDFLITKNNKPWFLVETKLSETKISSNLEYFSHRLNVPGIQLVLKKDIFRDFGNIILVSAER